jgi:AraC-like DNA-binding protein
MAIETPIVQIINTALITGVIYGIIFLGVIFLSSKRKGKPLLFLSLLVLFVSLNNLQTWLSDMGYTSTIPYIRHMRVPWYFMCMPMFYVFLVYYSKIQKKVISFLYISFGIFALLILVRLSLIIYSQVNQFDLLETKQFIDRYSSIEEIISFIYSLFIFIHAIKLLTRNRKWFEYVLQYDDLSWIKHFMIMGTIIIVIWVVAIYRSNIDGGFSAPQIYYPLRLITTILIYWVGFKGLFRYRVMEDRIVLRENIRKGINTKKMKALDIDPSKIHFDKSYEEKSEKQQELFDNIQNFVMEQKKFTDPYLSLESLAEELKISKGHLSYLINTYSGHNFSDYINSFRVEQVKKWMLDYDFGNYTIESIGLESGFNSKSTFYSAFKKFTDLTPSQFKQMNLTT